MKNKNYIISEDGLSPNFEIEYQRIIEWFFSRDSNKWPIFHEQEMKKIIEFRGRNLHPLKRVDAYPEGSFLLEKIKTEQHIPETYCEPGGSLDPLLLFAVALSKDWENPGAVENAIAMPCDPAIYGSMLSQLVSPNLVYSEYAGMAEKLEKMAVRQMATLAGYDPMEATGIFTQGGTFCNLYGYLLGIRKSLPNARLTGLDSGDDYCIINSQGGHYSNMTNLSLLGVDIKHKTIRIRITSSNEIDLAHLEHQMRACFNVNCLIPTIMLTLGTTDTFAVDRVKLIYDLRNRLCEEYGIKIKPHIHADAAIGWSMLFFADYDFESNPLSINESTLQGIKNNRDKFQEIKYTDSFTIDFHKWGYVPYISSLVMIKDKSDLKALENEPQHFSYFENDMQGKTHLQSTIECTRGAAGIFGAVSALTYMGKKGYQVILAHCLQNANYFRKCLQDLGYVKLIAPANQGPSVGFKIYNPKIITDVDIAFEYELTCMDSQDAMNFMQSNYQFHRRIFTNRDKIGLFTNWVEFITRSEYDSKGDFSYIPGEKAVFINPMTTRADIDRYIDSLIENVPS
ncbi:cytochrome D ubiquinol oxidase subunit II [Photorhabdus heterorhabditis]|uniref:Cytochrome D ubiquinol oxidase subunit II n=1 Tax=Photorhabdus heterorhabditis TaxID=880156 RepID=A0ABR5KD11_9GAMM|nr:pyridoxal-dependent decarboxylase [Photorhabdus heterorhabditis]KOY62362.1 cytochrome D ubiquinol oxidase subunit II [Photorhabdus heterorhabditis]